MPRSRAERRADAEAREQARAELNLTPQQRLAALDDKFGKGQGAKKERAKLLAAIEKVKQEQAAKKEKADKPKEKKKKA